MSAPKSTQVSLLESNRLLIWLICLACAIVLVSAVREAPVLGAGGVLVDFDAFYIAGQMIWEGRLPQAYDGDVMRAVQLTVSGHDTYLPFTYPPPFDLVVAVFPLGARGLSLAVFITLTFVPYVFVLRRLAGQYLTAVLVAILPALMVTAKSGQNGFLTGTLVGLFGLAFLRGKAVAGVPLGLMVIKPHLVIGLGVLVLVKRRWKTLLLALAVVMVFCGLATLAFGPEVWPAFLASVPEAQQMLQKGLYPLYRMTSAYAALYTLGVPPGAALIAQACVAAGACAAIVVAHLQGMALRHVLGLSCLATLAVSPYNYDYDMTILGVGLAVLAADLMTLARPREKLALLGLSWLCNGWGFWGLFVVATHAQPDSTEALHNQLSLAALGYVLLFALVWSILRRAPQNQQSQA